LTTGGGVLTMPSCFASLANADVLDHRARMSRARDKPNIHVFAKLTSRSQWLPITAQAERDEALRLNIAEQAALQVLWQGN